jgi:hypothetical protein
LATLITLELGTAVAANGAVAFLHALAGGAIGAALAIFFAGLIDLRKRGWAPRWPLLPTDYVGAALLYRMGLFVIAPALVIAAPALAEWPPDPSSNVAASFVVGSLAATRALRQRKQLGKGTYNRIPPPR